MRLRANSSKAHGNESGNSYCKGKVMSVETILNALDKVKRKSAGKWVAICPCHAEKTPSLAISETSDGAVLLHCFGCGAGAMDVIGALGIDATELFPRRDRYDYSEPKAPRPAFSAQQLLECINYETIIVMLAAEQLMKGIAIDVERVTTAHNRISAALHYQSKVDDAYGNRQAGSK